jgi:hypothetical protein
LSKGEVEKPLAIFGINVLASFVTSVAAAVYDFALPPIERSWELLSDVVRIHCTANEDPAFGESFEMLYLEGKRWVQHNSKITAGASQEA